MFLYAMCPGDRTRLEMCTLICRTILAPASVGFKILDAIISQTIIVG